MSPQAAKLICSLVAFSLALPAAVRGEAPVASAPGKATLTGKERLGPKWTDEQRIDNCNVPAEKRGNKPRPTTCPADLTH